MSNPGTRYPDIFAALSEEFGPREVRSRDLPGGRKASYVTARTVMNRLDSVVGPENWWDEYTPLQNGVLCKLTVRLPDGETICKSDAGGHAGMSDEGDDEKSGFSDAFKRAAVKFGVGRHLYGEGVPRYGAGAPAQAAPKTAEANPVKPAAGRPQGEPRPINAALPESGRAFYMWLQGQPSEIQAQAAKLSAEWGLPKRWIDCNREEVRDLLEGLGYLLPGSKRAKSLVVVGASGSQSR